MPIIPWVVLSVTAAGCSAGLTGGPAGAEPALSASQGDSATRTARVVTRISPSLPTEVEAEIRPWTFGADDGRVINTPSYRLYTTITDERILRRLPLFLERALVQYTTALADLPRPQRPLECYIFRDREQWTVKTREMLPGQAAAFENLGRGGFTTRGVSVLYHIDRKGYYRDTFAITAHEGWHQYTQSTFRDQLPVWLEEGIATYMEGFRPGRDHPQFQPARNWERRQALRDAFRRDRLIPLTELVTETPQAFLTESKDALLTYYAQVWVLTRFLAEGGDGRYRSSLAAVLGDASAGTLARKLRRAGQHVPRYRGRPRTSRSRHAVIAAYFNGDLAAFEEEYLAFARQVALAPGARGSWRRGSVD